MADLKPCPVCGGSADYFDDLYMEGTRAAISCQTCHICLLSDTVDMPCPQARTVEGRQTLMTAAWNNLGTKNG